MLGFCAVEVVADDWVVEPERVRCVEAQLVGSAGEWAKEHARAL